MTQTTADSLYQWSSNHTLTQLKLVTELAAGWQV